MTWWVWLVCGLLVGCSLGVVLAGLCASSARGGLLQLDTPAARQALTPSRRP